MNELPPTAEPAHAAVHVAFPGFGRRYLASFPAFRFELAFSPCGTLTWTRLLDDGSRGPSETVNICVDSVGGGLYFVSWRESNGTIVAHVEDFAQRSVVTHIRRSDGTLLRANGSLIELSAVARD
jgi:hypothetical protein